MPGRKKSVILSAIMEIMIGGSPKGKYFQGGTGNRVKIKAGDMEYRSKIQQETMNECTK